MLNSSSVYHNRQKNIIVYVPEKKDGKWKVSIYGGVRHRNSASVIFNAIERKLQPRQNKQKTVIKVKYGKDTFNESLASFDNHYLLFTLSCFLEDHLSKKVMNRVEKKYLHDE